MKKSILIFIYFFCVFSINAQTLIPYLLSNGKYRYMDSATKMVSNITGEINGYPTLFTKKGHAIYWESKTGDTRIINKYGEDIFKTRVGSREQFSNDVVYYEPIIISNVATDEEYIIAKTYDRSKKWTWEQNPGYRIYNDGKFSEYFDFPHTSNNTEINFIDGLAIASNSNNNFKKGFINKFGEFVIPQIFDQVRPFREGRSAVYSDDYKSWGFIDTKGNLVVPLKYSKVTDFQDGAALVNSKDGSSQYFIDKNGKKIIDFRGNIFSEYFSDSLINIDLFESSIHGFYDIKGQLKLSINYKVFNRLRNIKTIGFQYGTLRVEDNYKQIGLINKNGKLIVPFGKYKFIASYNDGLAGVEDKNGYWGFIDINGNEIIKPQFYSTHNFSEGLCAVKKINGWCFINKKGIQVIGIIDMQYADGKFIFDTINDFKNGLSFLSNNNDLRLYFDKSGYFYIEQ